ncbi:MAG: porin [Flammeovirgaceae bacterium]|nr:porin [Flammeovirgaceae bacterium]
MNFLKLIKNFALGAFALAFSSVALAQDEESSGPSFSVSGSVDTYFRTNLSGGTNDASDTLGTLAPGTSFANNPGFSLGMANMIISYEGEKVGFVADLVFGPRGTDAVFASPAPWNTVNQLYAYINVTDNFKLTLGNFNTFLGYEVISPVANFNYSTSYMFSYGPFSHTGLKADFSIGEHWNLVAAIMNPTDATDYNPSNDYVGGFQLGYSGAAGSAYLNAMVSEDFYQLDLTTGWDLSESFYLGFNATTQTNFNAAAFYLQGALSDAFALGVRAEYYSTTEDSAGGYGIAAEENVFNLTLSGPIKVGSLKIIPEIRLDALSYDGYTDADGAEGSSLSSFVLAAVYSF